MEGHTTMLLFPKCMMAESKRSANQLFSLSVPALAPLINQYGISSNDYAKKNTPPPIY